MRVVCHNIQYGTGYLRRLAWLGFWAGSRRHYPTLERFYRLADADVLVLCEVDNGSYRTGHRSQARALGRALRMHVACRSKYGRRPLLRRLPVLKTQANAILTRERPVAIRYHELGHGFKRLLIEVETPTLQIFAAHLSLGTRARRRQLCDLYDIISARRKPCILAGDFNFLSGPWEARLLLKALNLESANRPPRPTFPSWRPRRELDFICHSPELHLQRRRLPNVRLSDHLPLVCDFTLSDAPETTRNQGEPTHGKAQTPA